MTGAQRINRMIKSTHKRLYWLACVSAFGGFAAVLGVWYVLALLGVQDLISPKLFAACSLTVILGSIFLGLRSFRRFDKPKEQQAFNLVDELSENRPASTLIDNPVRPDAKAAALWASHQANVSKEAETLPFPSVWKIAKNIDPLFLRFIIPALLIGSFLYAGNSAPQRIKTAFNADFGTLVGADELKAQAWVSPPVYTGQAPFDVTINESFAAPSGSEMTIRVDTHGEPELKLLYGEKTKSMKLERGADGTFETKLTLDLKDKVRAEIHWWGQRAFYDITSNIDLKPQISFESFPDIDDNDRTIFSWNAEDDYGIVRVELILRPDAPKPGEEHEEDVISLNLPGIEPKTATSQSALNLTRHKWAGLQVIAALKVTDAAGQSSRTEEVSFELPEKLFLQPMAKAAMEVRNVVLRDWHEYPETITNDIEIADGKLLHAVHTYPLETAPDEIRRAAIMLDALTYRPETYFNDRAIYVGLRQARQILANANSKPKADASEDLLWAIAMRAEYGSFADAVRNLELARKALETALRDGASEKELKQLMQAYRQAVENYIDMRLAEAIRRGISPEELDGETSGAMQLGGSDIDKMLETLEELAETGAADQARQLLSDMSDLLDAMKNLQLSQSGAGDPLGSPQEGPFSEELEKLAEELRDQRDLNDDTQQALREQQGQPQSSGEGNQALTNRQQELLDRLDNNQSGTSSSSEFSEGPEDFGQDGEYPMDAEGFRAEDQGDAIAQAREAQRKAVEALEEGDLETASRHQKQAEQALTRAATELAEAADEILGETGQNSQQANQEDPLGRPSGRGLVGNGDDVEVPDIQDRQRAHQILEELRERSARQGLTEEELDYLLRLLKRF